MKKKLKTESWYDGKLYDILFSPLLVDLRKKIAGLIPAGRVLEIGCGTGELAGYINTNTEYYGIDLSGKMIERARKKKNNHGATFILGDVFEYHVEKKFDYVVFSLLLHSIDNILAEKLLVWAKENSEHIIIADYKIPQPDISAGKIIIKVIEVLAGRDHYQCFKKYKINNGISFFAEKSSMKKLAEENYGMFQIVKLGPG